MFANPGVFTSLTRRLGIKGLELIELYDIEPWAVEDLDPHGLIFCFMWRKDSHRATDFNDPAAERVWFANQLSDDACATHAILNVLLNCPVIDIGEELRALRKDTERMSPVVRYSNMLVIMVLFIRPNIPSANGTQSTVLFDGICWRKVLGARGACAKVVRILERLHFSRTG